MERTGGENSRASAADGGRLQAAVFAQQSEHYQAGNQRGECCRAHNKEVRNFIAKRMGVRRPGFMRPRGAQAGEDSGEAKETFHLAMVWPELEKSSLGFAE